MIAATRPVGPAARSWLQRGDADMFDVLMRSRRFAPLFWCQFCSALNDNFLKNALAMLVLFGIGSTHGSVGDNAGVLVTLAGVVFIAPFFLFSAIGGGGGGGVGQGPPPPRHPPAAAAPSRPPAPRCAPRCRSCSWPGPCSASGRRCLAR